MSLEPHEAKRRSGAVTQTLMNRVCLPQASASFGQTTARPIVKNPSWAAKSPEVRIEKPKVCRPNF